MGIRVPNLDGHGEETFSRDRLVPYGLERDAVDEGRDEDPGATRGDERQHDVGANTGPSQAEEASVQQQDGQLAAGEAGGVEEEPVPFFLEAGVGC